MLEIFFFVDQDVGLVEDPFHALGVGDEVGGEVAAVEAHAFHQLQGGLQALGLLDRDDAFLADLVHGVGEDVADGLVVVGGDGAHLGDLGAVARGLGQALQAGHDLCHRLVDAALHRHGVMAGRRRS